MDYDGGAYDITVALKKIEDELIASMIRNMDRHRAEEDKEGLLWSQWQVEQLKAGAVQAAEPEEICQTVPAS